MVWFGSVRCTMCTFSHIVRFDSAMCSFCFDCRLLSCSLSYFVISSFGCFIYLIALELDVILLQSALFMLDIFSSFTRFTFFVLFCFTFPYAFMSESQANYIRQIINLFAKCDNFWMKKKNSENNNKQTDTTHVTVDRATPQII